MMKVSEITKAVVDPKSFKFALSHFFYRYMVSLPEIKGGGELEGLSNLILADSRRFLQYSSSNGQKTNNNVIPMPLKWPFFPEKSQKSPSGGGVRPSAVATGGGQERPCPP